MDSLRQAAKGRSYDDDEQQRWDGSSALTDEGWAEAVPMYFFAARTFARRCSHGDAV